MTDNRTGLYARMYDSFGITDCQIMFVQDSVRLVYMTECETGFVRQF